MSHKPQVLHDTIDRIYSIFEPHISKPKKDDPVRWLPTSKIFEVLGGVASHEIIYKAKKALGIKSTRIAGKWVWMLPTKAPAHDMQRLHKQRLDTIGKQIEKERVARNKQARVSVACMMAILQQHQFDVTANEALEEMRGSNGYSHRTARLAKQISGAESIKGKDGWHWVLPAQEVQDWIEHRLRAGAVPYSDLVKEAQVKGWSERVLRSSRVKLGGIKSEWRAKQHYWYDMNHYTPDSLKPEPTSEEVAQ